MRAHFGIRLALVLAIGSWVLSSGAGARAEAPIGWTWDQVTTRQAPFGGSELLVRGANLHLGEPGEPDLPASLVRIRAPEGHRVGSVAIDGEITSTRDLTGTIGPVLLDAPSTAGGPMPVEPLESAYGMPLFPSDRVVYLGIALERGVAWAQFAVYPLLLEEGRRLNLLEAGGLQIDWVADPSVPIPFKSLREDHGDAVAKGFARTLQGPAGTVTDRPALSSAPVEYLILTTDALSQSVRPFAQWKNQTGTPTAVRTVSWVLENYPDGVDSQERIRTFFKEAYRYWGLRWALIVGGPAEVPMRAAKSYEWNLPHGEDIITDLYYACLDGTWNADGDDLFGEPREVSEPVGGGDGVDFNAELMISRVPATSASQFNIWLSKYFKYVQDPVTDGYLDRVLLMGEVLFQADWTRAGLPSCGRTGDGCATGCESCVNLDGAEDCVRVVDIIDVAPGVSMNYVELYEWYEYWQGQNRPNALLLDKASVVSRINEGAGIVHHVGHGDRDRLSVGTNDGTDGNGRYLLSDARAMSNGDRVGFVYAINCNSAAIDFDCIAEAMIFASNGGMVNYIGSTNLDFPSAATTYMQTFYSKIFERDFDTIGEAYSTTISEQMAGNPTYRSYRRFLAYSLIDLGDSQQSIWLGTPGRLVVSAPTSMPLGQSSLTVSVTMSGSGSLVSGAKVCAYKDGDVFALGTTDASGQVVLPFRPKSVGSFRITATHPQAIPFKEDAIRTVTSPSGTPPLAVTGLPVNDETGTQTAGNANSRFEVGETIKLDVVLTNGGSQAVNNVALTLTVGPATYTSYVEVLDGSETIATVNGNATIQASGAFRLKLKSSPSIPTSLYQNGDRLPLVATVRVQAGSNTEDFVISLPAYRPLFELENMTLVEVAGTGNGDNRPNNGETMQWSPLLRNVGTGSAANLTGYLTAVAGATVTEDDAVLESGELGDPISVVTPLEFVVTDQSTLRLNLTIRSALDSGFEFLNRAIEFSLPTAPSFPTEKPPGATKDAVILTWTGSTSGDVQGYVIERSLDVNEEFQQIHSRLIRQMRYYRDEGLQGLTRFYYRVAAVDSSGNRSSHSNVVGATTTPGMLAGWPFSVLSDMNWGCPTVENIDGIGPYEVFTTADNVYGLRSTAQEIIDGDGISSTPGVWSSLGGGFWSKPAIGDLDGDGNVEIVATSRYESAAAGIAHLFVWNGSGELLWSKTIGSSNYFMASPVIADIDGDVQGEVIAHLRGGIYAWNHDGSPVITANADGLLAFVAGANQAAWPYATGSPAAADVDNDGKDEIVLGVETNLSDRRSRLSVVDGDGTILAEADLETPAGGDVSSANSSPSLADVDDDGVYEIFIATRNYLWAYYYDAPTRTLKPEPGWPAGGRVSINKLPTNWVEPTPAVGDVNADGFLEVVIGVGQGRVMAVKGSNGEALPFFPYALTSEMAKIGSPILVQMDNDAAAEIVIGDNDGILYALDAQTLDQIAGFPYVVAGRIQHGLNYWDLDRNRQPDLLVQAEQNQDVIVLNISNVVFPDDFLEAMARNPWTSFRHDARNSGTFDKGVITPVVLIEVLATAEAGAAVLEWEVPVEPQTFRIQRQGADGIWEKRIEGPASLFREGEGYRFRDEGIEPGPYLYRVSGFDGAGREIYRSGEIAVTILPLGLRLVAVVPNPFNPRASIQFETPGGSIRLEIFDPAGRKVRTLVDGLVVAGAHERIWDGRDDAGREVGSGVYLVRLRGTGGSRSQKMVLLR